MRDFEVDDAAEWFGWVPIIAGTFVLEWADDATAPVPYELICGCKGVGRHGGKFHTASCPMSAAYS